MLDEGLDNEIAVIRGPIWDNCRDYCKKCDRDIPENEEVRVIRWCPSCDVTLGFMSKAGILEYLKILPEDERVSRETGQWLHLSGLVYKVFAKTTHLYEDFTPPTHWMMIESVDPHDARPTNWLFGAISPEEIEIFGKTRNRVYWYTYVSASGSVEDIVRSIKSTRALYGYQDPYAVMLDKKYGTAAQMVSYDNPERRTWQSELERAGIKRIKLSHSSPGDVELGHKIVKEYLKPQFSSLTSTARPGMLFAKNGCSGYGSPIQQMMSYQYDEKTEKADDKYKDWPDCYDAETQVLTGTGWKFFNELSISDFLVTKSLTTGNLEFEQPIDFIQRHYHGPMVKYEGRALDLMVTPGHNMLVADGGGPNYTNYKWRFRKAENVSKWMVLPISSKGINNAYSDLSDLDYQFMGWYLAEGCCTGTRGGKIQTPGRGYQVMISQIESSPYVPELMKMFKQLPYNFHYTGRNFIISNKSFWEKVRPLGNSHEKYIPEQYFTGTPFQLKLLWDSYVKGDGWMHRGRPECATVSFRLANDLQRLLALLGVTSSIRERQPQDSIIRGRKVYARSCSVQYYVTPYEGDIIHLTNGDKEPLYKTVDYEGDIFCVTVPNHTLLVRRKKVPLFCGNCVRYVALEQFTYRSPDTERKVVDTLKSRMADVYEKRNLRLAYGG